ncbi:MAG: RAMP superfamily CRISPR-associated protein [Acidobacteria bacterium]|nr:RAMP superfamily CRISPR-associated protein [Acidobacteriota bacterium]
MPALQISLTINFDTPPSVGAGGTAGTLADKVVTRDARGRFVIPASQVKGKLRHACEQMLRSQGVVALCNPPRPDEMCPNAASVPRRTDSDEPTACLLCSIFGSPALRSRLRFHDLTTTTKDLPSETLRAMVSLNRRRRTSEPQRLFLVETAPNFKGLTFANTEAVTGYVSEAAHAHLLLAGLKLLFAWGGGSSRGLGWGSLSAEATLGGEAVQFNAEEVRALCQSSPSR